MAGRRIAFAACAALACILVAGMGRPLAAQLANESGWTARIGGGLGLHGSCVDCDADPVGGSAALGIEYRTSPEWGFGLSWTSVWLGGELTGLNRRALSLDATRYLGSAGPYLRFSAGTAVSTIVAVDGPPDPPDVGDIVIGIGDTQGVSGALGVGWRTPVGPLLVAPELGLIGQRVSGTTITAATVVLQILIG